MKSVAHQKVLSKLGSQFGLDESLFSGLELFTCEMYGIQTCASIDEAGHRLFSTSNLDETKLPACRDSIWFHSLRANYQTAINRMALERLIDTPCPSEHGWTINDGCPGIKWGCKGVAPVQILKGEKC